MTIPFRVQGSALRTGRQRLSAAAHEPPPGTNLVPGGGFFMQARQSQ